MADHLTPPVPPIIPDDIGDRLRLIKTIEKLWKKVYSLYASPSNRHWESNKFSDHYNIATLVNTPFNLLSDMSLMDPYGWEFTKSISSLMPMLLLTKMCKSCYLGKAP